MRRDAIQLFAAHYRKSNGKPQSVRAHLEETSTLASEFAGKIGLSSLGELAGLLHDLGKYSSAFQDYLASAVGHPSSTSGDEERVDAKQMKGKIDHSTAGAQLAWNEALRSASPVVHLAGQMMALCVSSHHAGLIDCLSTDGTDAFSTRMAKSIEATCRKEEEEHVRDCAAKLMASSLIEDELRCWLENARTGNGSLQIRAFTLGLLARFLFSALIDADRLDTAGFEDEALAVERYHGSYPEWGVLIEKLETHLAGLETRSRVDQARREVSAACLGFAKREKGLYQLTVPTGGGKTLASLRFALHHANARRMDRVIYVAPYISIIDQNAGVARSILEKGNNSGKLIVLEHHSNLAAEQDTWQSRLLSENWDAPVVFTTAVQFLETLFGGGTREARRMHQLANAVIIFDEVQTTPVNTVHLFNNAVNFLVGQCGSTVVFCTATQPLIDRVDASKGAARLSTDPQMMPDVPGLFRDLRRVEIHDERKVGGWTEEEVADAALQEMNDAGSVLVVVNTKAQARELYLRCRKKTKNVFHLSTSMCPAHRMNHLNRIKRRLDPEFPKPVICISTQLIEAGVDIDFGSVIRYLAGLDSIAQAAGRCNRNGLRTIGSVIVLNSLRENLDKLPDIRRAQEIGERVLDEFRKDPKVFDFDLLSPKAMDCFYRYYFFARAHEMAYPVSSREIGRDETLLALLSTNEQAVEAYKRARKAAPSLLLRQSFKTAGDAFKAIDSPADGVVVPYRKAGAGIINRLLACTKLDKRMELLRQAQRYSVNMFPHEIEQLRRKDRLSEVWEGSGVYYLDSRHYSDEFGVSVEQVGEMEMLAV